MRDWLPEGHLARLVDERVDQLDRSAIYTVYQSADDRGRRGYHLAMMVKLLVYAYCVGKLSSRTIERATFSERPSKPHLQAPCARSCRVPRYNHLRHGELEGSGGERPRSPRT